MITSYLTLKGLLDQIAAFVLLILLTPFLLVIALVVYIFLGSPVLFKQLRPGYLGKPFWLLKFRSMVNSRDSSGVLLADAQRLTLLGRWLRATSIDELPSLINIAKGEMSFVGPRPFVIAVDDYDRPFLRRFNARPGLTGLAQVNGRNAIPWKKKFEYDCLYVDNMSFLQDCSILLKTILIVMDFRSTSAKGHVTAPVYRKKQ